MCREPIQTTAKEEKLLLEDVLLIDILRYLQQQKQTRDSKTGDDCR